MPLRALSTAGPTTSFSTQHPAVSTQHCPTTSLHHNPRFQVHELAEAAGVLRHKLPGLAAQQRSDVRESVYGQEVLDELVGRLCAALDA
jgi:hypothetical protein